MQLLCGPCAASSGIALVCHNMQLGAASHNDLQSVLLYEQHLPHLVSQRLSVLAC